MNGRDVFNFSATEVPTQIRKLLSLSEMSLDNVDLFVLHQGSRFIVETIQRKLGITSERVPIKLKDQGNTISSSIPLILSDVIHDPAYSTIVISGFGVGLSWSSAILQRSLPRENMFPG